MGFVSVHVGVVNVHTQTLEAFLVSVPVEYVLYNVCQPWLTTVGTAEK